MNNLETLLLVMSCNNLSSKREGKMSSLNLDKPHTHYFNSLNMTGIYIRLIFTSRERERCIYMPAL